MIKCPICQTTQVDNTIFCNECGGYLLEDGDRATTDRMNEIGWMGESTDNSGTASPFQADSTPRAIRLKISPSNREVEVSLDKAILIGRVDPAASIFPELDLTDEDSPAKNVSRRHVRILQRGETVFVEDLGSINGTFVNGRKLDPYLIESLNDGDTLQLGELLIEVEFRERTMI